MKLKEFFWWALRIEIFYLMLATVLPLPSWKMFANIDLPSYKLMHMESKEEVPIDKYLPSIHYSFPESELKKFSEFVCQELNEALILEMNAPPERRYVIKPKNCKISKL